MLGNLHYIEVYIENIFKFFVWPMKFVVEFYVWEMIKHVMSKTDDLFNFRGLQINDFHGSLNAEPLTSLTLKDLQ